MYLVKEITWQGASSFSFVRFIVFAEKSWLAFARTPCITPCLLKLLFVSTLWSTNQENRRGLLVYVLCLSICLSSKHGKSLTKETVGKNFKGQV